jgi:DNA-binding transcriptional LysR family regulator
MFPRLFAQTGLSLERLRALVEVGAFGSIVKAADSEPARQSLYSRQIKELEDFFQVPLLERHGRGVRLTASGRELARISRFFLLGLSNFQRGCLAEGQTYRVAADATFVRCFLVPALTELGRRQTGIHFSIEIASGDAIERRLHDLTLDFGIVTQETLSRPLQFRELGRWRLNLWVPKSMARTAAQAERGVEQGKLPLVSAEASIRGQQGDSLAQAEPPLVCPSFMEACDALATGGYAGLLPDFLEPPDGEKKFFKVPSRQYEGVEFRYHFAWNPRLLRLNPHAGRRRDALVMALTARMAESARRAVFPTAAAKGSRPQPPAPRPRPAG